MPIVQQYMQPTCASQQRVARGCSVCDHDETCPKYADICKLLEQERSWLKSFLRTEVARAMKTALGQIHDKSAVEHPFARLRSELERVAANQRYIHEGPERQSDHDLARVVADEVERQVNSLRAAQSAHVSKLDDQIRAAQASVQATLVTATGQLEAAQLQLKHRCDDQLSSLKTGLAAQTAALDALRVDAAELQRVAQKRAYEERADQQRRAEQSESPSASAAALAALESSLMQQVEDVRAEASRQCSKDCQDKLQSLRVGMEAHVAEKLSAAVDGKLRNVEAAMAELRAERASAMANAEDTSRTTTSQLTSTMQAMIATLEKRLRKSEDAAENAHAELSARLRSEHEANDELQARCTRLESQVLQQERIAQELQASRAALEALQARNEQLEARCARLENRQQQHESQQERERERALSDAQPPFSAIHSSFLPPSAPVVEDQAEEDGPSLGIKSAMARLMSPEASPRATPLARGSSASPLPMRSPATRAPTRWSTHAFGDAPQAWVPLEQSVVALKKKAPGAS